MYESPIELIYSERMKEIKNGVDDTIFRAVMNTGIEVDKEELIQALEYDRNQYEKGYQDGRCMLNKIRNEIDSALSNEILSDNKQQISDVGIGLELALSIIDKYKAESEMHCNCTDKEIAKSFIEDVEAVKDLLLRTESEE